MCMTKWPLCQESTGSSCESYHRVSSRCWLLFICRHTFNSDIKPYAMFYIGCITLGHIATLLSVHLSVSWQCTFTMTITIPQHLYHTRYDLFNTDAVSVHRWEVESPETVQALGYVRVQTVCQFQHLNSETEHCETWLLNERILKGKLPWLMVNAPRHSKVASMPVSSQTACVESDVNCRVCDLLDFSHGGFLKVLRPKA